VSSGAWSLAETPAIPQGGADIAIHPTAIIDPKAEIDPTSDIGPYVIIDGPVRIGAGTRVYWHATICGRTEIGSNCRIHPYAIIGHVPQDRAYADEDSGCHIGDETIVREYASVHRGTGEGMTTVIGKRCFLMASVHVGHNCEIGDDVTMANATLLAGHVSIGNRTFLSGMAGVHQFVRIGELAMIGGQAMIRMDVPPFFTAVRFGECSGINAVGLKRAGFSAEERKELHEAYRLLYRSGQLFGRSLEELTEKVHTEPGRRLVQFLLAPSKRGITGGRQADLNSPIDEE
jgi:UDP-N-acetylglucosamine acyltransferase